MDLTGLDPDEKPSRVGPKRLGWEKFIWKKLVVLFFNASDNNF